MRRLVRALRSTIAALTLSVLAATCVLAADHGPWVVAAINGPVVFRAGDTWQEVDTQQSLPSPFIRTLKNGAVRLQRGGMAIALGSESIADVSDGDGGVAVLQYLGEVAISTSGTRPPAARVDGGGVRVSNIAGTMSLVVTEHGAQVTVHEGSVHVAFGNGEDRLLESGSVMTADTQKNTVTVTPADPALPDVAVGLLDEDSKGDGNPGAIDSVGNGNGKAAGGGSNQAGQGNVPGANGGTANGAGQNANGNGGGADGANGNGNAAAGDGSSDTASTASSGTGSPNGANANSGAAQGGIGTAKTPVGAQKGTEKAGKKPVDLLPETAQ